MIEGIQSVLLSLLENVCQSVQLSSATQLILGKYGPIARLEFYVPF